jgi:tetratricopeptide (TPR) repeat protein
VRQQEGRTAPALASFRDAVKYRPRYAEAQARVCELETVTARARDTGFDGALADCRRAVTLNPRDPEPHFHAGFLQSKLGNLPGAISSYQTALKLDPRFPRVRFELAMAYLDAQQPAPGIALLKEVTATEPGNANARFQLGAALARQGDCPAAVPWLQSGTESAQKHYLLATCYRKLGRPAEAAASLDRVKALRDGAEARMQAKFLAAAAHQKAQAGQLDAAIADYRNALELAPDPSLRIDLAVALLKKGAASDVLPLLEGDRTPLARYQVALALAKLGRLDETAAALTAITAEAPNFVEAWYQLGIAQLARNQPAEAEQSLAKAVALRPDEPAFRQALNHVRSRKSIR